MTLLLNDFITLRNMPFLGSMPFLGVRGRYWAFLLEKLIENEQQIPD
jgi:hypothetical protein